jgi:hypothetical protein
LAIGDDESGPEYEFDAVLAVTGHADGHVVVVQRSGQQLRAFDANGKHLRAIGRSGDGPGEFRFVTAAGFLGDTLWTLDAVLRRITFYGRDGKVLSSIQQTEGGTSSGRGPSYYFQPMALLANGGVIAYGGTDTEALVSGAVTRTPVVRTSRSGTVTDTLHWIPVGRPPMVFKQGDRTTYAVQRLADGDGFTIIPSLNRVYVFQRRATAVGSRWTFGITALTDRGRVLWRRSFPYTPTPMPAERVDSAVERATEDLRKSGMAVTASQVRAQMYIPQFVSPFSGGATEADGHLWLRREENSARQDYWVFDATGRHVARVLAPAGAQLRSIQGNTAWGVERGDDDVPLIVKYRIERTPAPAARP